MPADEVHGLHDMMRSSNVRITALLG